MLIQELLSFTYPIHTNSEGNVHFTTADGSIVLVGFEWTADHMISIEFVREGKDEYAPSWDITGQGDAIKIFSTIVQIVKGYLKRYNPPAFYFTAKESSRVKLYERLANRFDGELGYKRIKKGPKFDDVVDFIKHGNQEDHLDGQVFFFEKANAPD